MSDELSYFQKAYSILVGLGDVQAQWVELSFRALMALPWLLIADAVGRRTSTGRRVLRAAIGIYAFSRVARDVIFWAPMIIAVIVCCAGAGLFVHRDWRRPTHPVFVSFVLAIASWPLLVLASDPTPAVWLVYSATLSGLFAHDMAGADRRTDSIRSTVVWSIMAAMLILPGGRLNLRTYLPVLVSGWLGWLSCAFVLWRHARQAPRRLGLTLLRMVATGLCGVLAAALILEVYFAHIYDESDANSALPTSRHWMMRHVQYNSWGYRDREFEPLDRFDQSLRVLLLGDSFAYGLGVDRASDLFGARLQAELNSRIRSVPVVVFNVSVPGIGTREERTHLEAVGSRIKPHVVVLLYVPNDIGSSVPFKPVKHPALMRWEPLTRSSYSLSFLIWHVYRVFYWSTRPYPNELDLYRDDEVFAQHTQALENLFAEISAMGARCFVAVHPFVAMSAQTDPQRFALDRLDAFLETAHVPSIDLSKVADTSDPRFVVNRFDPHPNAALMRITARATAVRVAELLETMTPDGNARSSDHGSDP